MFKAILLFISSYLLGSIPFGVLISKKQKIDIREYGSGNIGATNVFRTVGKKAGFLTLMCDSLKGFIPVLIALLLTDSEFIIGMVGLFVIIGHIYPVFSGFKGGKGVATSLGVFFGLMPKVAFIVIIVWFVVCLLFRYVSLSSMASALTVPVLAGLFDEPKFYILVSTFVAFLIVVKHKDNLKRLLAGEEDKFQWQRK